MRWALAASVRHTDAGAAALLPADGVASEGSAAWLRGAAAGRSDREGSSLDAVSDARGGIMSAAARCRRPPSLTRHVAGLPRRPAAAQQGDPLPADPPTVEEIIAVMR